MSVGLPKWILPTVGCGLVFSGGLVFPTQAVKTTGWAKAGSDQVPGWPRAARADAVVFFFQVLFEGWLKGQPKGKPPLFGSPYFVTYPYQCAYSWICKQSHQTILGSNTSMLDTDSNEQQEPL